MAYNEILQRGKGEFTVSLYCVNENHPRYRMAYHWHSEIEIIRIISGVLMLSVNDTEYKLTEGNVAVVNPELVHGALPCNCIYEVIVFKPEGLFSSTVQTRSFCSELLSGNILLNCVYREDSDIKNAADALFASLKNSYDYYHIEALSALYGFFGTIIKKGLYKNQLSLPYSQSSKKILKLKKALSFIRKSYNQQISLHDMAKEAEMSHKYFCAVFKELTHQTPFEYLTSYRLERASTMLTETDTSVTDIAFSCGFNDLSYFIKTFKKYKGVTPARYRSEKL